METNVEVNVEVFGFLSGDLWNAYIKCTRHPLPNNGNGGGSFLRNLRAKLPERCPLRQCEHNTELLSPYYMLSVKGKTLSKECLAVLIERAAGSGRGTETAAVMVAKAVSLYKKYRKVFLLERGETDFRLAMLRVKMSLEAPASGEELFTVPVVDKKVDFLFINIKSQSFAYLARGWDMYFKSFKDHLPSLR